MRLPAVERAGTRGFRGPEVLLRVAEQTVALDIWAAGVILLSILTQRYPFFTATEDVDALAELAIFFGPDVVDQAARQMQSTTWLVLSVFCWHKG